MSDENRAGELILSKIGMFNSAVVLYEDTIESNFLNAVDQAIESFAEAHDWGGDFGLHLDSQKENGTWLAPGSWKQVVDESLEADQSPEYRAWVAVGWMHGKSDYWIPLFCNKGVDRGRAGFMFLVTPNSAKGGKRAWNAYAKNINTELINKLVDLGFEDLKDGKFFMPVTFDAGTLAATWRESGEFSYDDDAFKPLADGLRNLKAAKEIFDQILEEAPL